jgi:hypothetical protein
VLNWRAAAAVPSPSSTTLRTWPLGLSASVRILVDVHSVLRESLVFGDFRVPVRAEWTTS